ncbi:hypothetical protein AAFF_G00362120 [Aldrovandia affinis]|uniref:Uncharacterized protein n=1 Tax=Aldrovandia affinis TaxID=143900 RepID=A0AAD7WN60_9TELE|nr:hypothetical protein AAFF_G00362120 [Aldrovandia affinis]
MNQKLSGATEMMSVNVGDTVMLHCDIKHEKETLWFGQRPNDVPFLSFSAIRKPYDIKELFTQSIVNVDLRYTVVLDVATSSVNLKIENVTESDGVVLLRYLEEG